MNQAIKQFNTLYESLSKTEQDLLMEYVLTQKVTVANEGYKCGPYGNLILRGIVGGPVGTSNNLAQLNCPSCGKPI